MNTEITLKAWWILIEDWKIYVVYRSSLNDYSLPKGRLEIWESITECAIREFKEETGINAAIIDFCYKMEYKFTEWNIINYCFVFFYLMKRLDNNVTDIAEDISSWSMVSIKDAYELLSYESDKNALKFIMNELW